jgi:hypothetical protein
MTLPEPSVERDGYSWGLDADDLRWFVEQWIRSGSTARLRTGSS